MWSQKSPQIAPAEIGEAQKAYDQAREVYQELIRNLVRRTDTYKSDARRPWIGTPTQGKRSVTSVVVGDRRG